MNIKTQLRRFYLFGFSSCLRIPDAVWVVLLAARGFDLWQIGMAEGIFHMVSLLCEIPSGMAADLLGRRRTLAAAGICGILSALLMSFSTQFSGICLSMVFSALSCTFLSGSDEALLYDSLLQAGQPDDYLQANARYTQIQGLGSMLSNAASVLTRFLSHVQFYLLDAAVCVVRVVTALRLREPAVTEAQHVRQQNPLQGLNRKFRQLITQSARLFRKEPRLLFIMLADGLISLPSFLTLMFLQQRLHTLGLPAMWLGLPIMAISLSHLAGAAIGERLKPRRLKNLYTACALLVGIGTFTAGTAPILPATLGAMTAAAAMDACMLHIQKHLNDHFPSDQRATLVSVDMMAYSLLMILSSPLVGWLGDVTGSAGSGLAILGGVVTAVGVSTAITLRK